MEELKRSIMEKILRPERRPLPPERLSLSQTLYGILKFDGDPPTDEELKDHYADYVTEKYS